MVVFLPELVDSIARKRVKTIVRDIIGIKYYGRDVYACDSMEYNRKLFGYTVVERKSKCDVSCFLLTYCCMSVICVKINVIIDTRMFSYRPILLIVDYTQLNILNYYLNFWRISKLINSRISFKYTPVEKSTLLDDYSLEIVELKSEYIDSTRIIVKCTNRHNQVACQCHYCLIVFLYVLLLLVIQSSNQKVKKLNFDITF